MATNDPVNPLRGGLTGERVPPPCTMVIFGASGDLTKRKLVPALYSLGRDRLLPSSFNVVGVARRPIGDEAFRKNMRESTDKFARKKPTGPDDALWGSLVEGMFYVDGTFEDPATYQKLKTYLDELDKKRPTHGNRVFYLSTPPDEYPKIIAKLGEAGLINKDRTGPFTRVIIEKPFGRDLASAVELNGIVHNTMREDQAYRIDHYLGKETVQNILVFRFANALFEPIWNARHVDHVQLIVSEAIGVEGRGGYFESAGIVRDMVQNHMFQFLCMMAMEPPVALRGRRGSRREAQGVALAAAVADGPCRLRQDGGARAVRPRCGQRCGAGRVPGGASGVAADSKIETFVALKLFVDNWRWGGVPFYLRAGKALPKRVTEIAIHFKRVPHSLFAQNDKLAQDPNVLSIRIQPDEGISLQFFSEGAGPDDGDAAGAHGVPLWDVVRRRAARGLRAAAARLHAGRRHAVHARRRGRGVVAFYRPVRKGVGRAPRAVLSQLCRRLLGPRRGERAHRARRAPRGGGSRRRLPSRRPSSRAAPRSHRSRSRRRSPRAGGRSPSARS